MIVDKRIHQFIFAGPKPGLSAPAFQSYWINFHAVDYAAKIPQIREYLVASRITADVPLPVSFFEGVAEIWIENDADQLASLQSPEFLTGARVDEPRWAAFWRTFVHDGETVQLKVPDDPCVPFTKLYIMIKRRQGYDRVRFRDRLIEAALAAEKDVPGVEAHQLAFARESLYGFGEPRFDVIEVWSFGTAESLREALTSSAFHELLDQTYGELAEPGAVFTFAGQDHWVINPGVR